VTQENYIEELFCMFSLMNKTSRQTLFDKMEGFLHILALHTGCHICAIRGYECGSDNTHEHCIIKVEKSELTRFRKHFATFDSSRVWRQVHEMQQFDHTRRAEAYDYVINKHAMVMPDDSKCFFCPEKYNQCKNKRCRHIPTPV
jgi:hypothetical protein